jgi:hypothetical protein
MTAGDRVSDATVRRQLLRLRCAFTHLATAIKERGISFKEALNSAVRAGLTQRKPRRGSFVQTCFSLGGVQNFRWDKALGIAAAIEDEELGRKLGT